MRSFSSKSNIISINYFTSWGGSPQISTLYPFLLCFWWRALMWSRKGKQTSKRTGQNNVTYTVNIQSVVLTSSVLHRTKHVTFTQCNMGFQCPLRLVLQVKSSEITQNCAGMQREGRIWRVNTFPFSFSDPISIYMYISAMYTYIPHCGLLTCFTLTFQ